MILTTTSVPIGRWARIEVHLTSHATNGQATVRLYREVDSPYVTETVTSSATFNTKPNAAYMSNPRFGISTAAPSMTCYLDDIAIDYQGWIRSCRSCVCAADYCCKQCRNGHKCRSSDTREHFIDRQQFPDAVFKPWHGYI